MKQRTTVFRRLAPAALAVTLLLTAASPAALAVSYVNARQMPQRTVVVDGVAQTFYNVNGQEVHPLSYDGTTYLPVRSIGELMNKDVFWNNDTKTITLTGPRTTALTTGTPDAHPTEATVAVSIRDDFTIIVDGVTTQFYDAAGNRVYPLLCNGVTYLPIRAVGELMGKVVSWNQTTQTVTLSGTVDSEGNLVTDADGFETGTSGSTGGTTTSYITAETAKAKALAHAGLTTSQVTFVRAYPDWDDGRYIYDVEFYTSDYKEYDYEIDAATGKVLSFDYDADHYTRPSQPSTGTTISAETAKAKALAHAGLTASQVTFVRAYLDWDDGRYVYDVEFYTSDYKEYDYEIDAATGKVLSFDYDADHYTRPTQPSTGTDIGLEKAKSIALAQVSGASSAHIREAKRDYDDGRLEYEVKIVYNNYEYEFEIDGTTGTILSRDVESVWD